MIIYCLSIAFQLAGALVLLIYGVSTKRTTILSSFSDNVFIGLDGNTKEVNDLSIPIKSKFKQAFLNKSAFICLAIGYLLGVFGSIDETERFLSLLIIIAFTILIIIGIHIIVRISLKQAKVINSVTISELEQVGIKPNVESSSNEDIQKLFKV